MSWTLLKLPAARSLNQMAIVLLLSGLPMPVFSLSSHINIGLSRYKKVRESVNCFFSIPPFMRQANEMHIVKGLMFCGMESFKLDVPGLVMANIYQKKKKGHTI